MNESKKKLFAAGYMFAVSCLALTAASFAWFEVSRTPQVDELGLEVMTDLSLELAPDIGGRPGEWQPTLDLARELEGIGPLKPVTYINTVGRRGLYAPGYRLDGRPSWDSAKLLNDQVNGSVRNRNTDAYYVAYDFWVRANHADCTVALAKSMVAEDGSIGRGTYLIGAAEDGAPVASETAIRLGFRINEVDSSGRVGAEERFIIYEPNADRHVHGDVGIIPTESVEGIQYYTPQDYFIQQASFYSGRADAYARVTPGNFQTQDLDMFDIYSGEMKKITLYIWLEGQDIDCDNSSVDVDLHGNIQFETKNITNRRGIIAR